jgi:hypothetical protein
VERASYHLVGIDRVKIGPFVDMNDVGRGEVQTAHIEIEHFVCQAHPKQA